LEIESGQKRSSLRKRHGTQEKPIFQTLAMEAAGKPSFSDFKFLHKAEKWLDGVSQMANLPG
jgi:hypothetical protein